MGGVGQVLDEVDQGHVTVVRGTDKVLHPRVIGVGPEVHLEISEDAREGLEVEEESLSRTSLFQFRLGVSD